MRTKKEIITDLTFKMHQDDHLVDVTQADFNAKSLLIEVLIDIRDILQNQETIKVTIDTGEYPLPVKIHQ